MYVVDGVYNASLGEYMVDGVYDNDGKYISPLDLEELLNRINTLFDAIAHGDDEHRAWLKQAIEDHFAGREVKRP